MVIMEITISVVIAYMWSGISQVMEGLGGRVIDRPMWAMNIHCVRFEKTKRR